MLIDLFADLRRPHKHDENLIKDLIATSENLQNTYARFNEATDNYEIDSLIFRLNELELHYSYLVKCAKLEKVSACGKVGGIWE